MSGRWVVFWVVWLLLNLSGWWVFQPLPIALGATAIAALAVIATVAVVYWIEEGGA